MQSAFRLGVVVMLAVVVLATCGRRGALDRVGDDEKATAEPAAPTVLPLGGAAEEERSEPFSLPVVVVRGTPPPREPSSVAPPVMASAEATPEAVPPLAPAQDEPPVETTVVATDAALEDADNGDQDDGGTSDDGPPTPEAGPPSPCPDDMVYVAGAYCPKPFHQCRHWMDPAPYDDFRCAEYAQPARCTMPRVSKRFCIDRYEYVAPGDKLPAANHSWTSAGQLCQSLGKRLCLESEWQFACEGEEMRPYPYGFSRDATACNIDQMHLGRPQEGLRDLRTPADAHPRCVSPFGVHGMSGNVEEWATLDYGVAPDRSTMKGAWWLPGKNTCRAATTGHGETYRGPQVGVRCCRDVVAAP